MLAQRLRSLREDRWPELKLTQAELARTLGGRRPISVPLISSWESRTNPVIPPVKWIDAYATLFATDRSVAGGSLRLLSLSELMGAERQARDELRKELLQLRNNAQRATAELPAVTGGRLPHRAAAGGPLASGLWYFPDGTPVTIVCAQPPGEMLESLPYADPTHPDYIRLYRYADLDSLFELHGHIRAANPTTEVNLRAAGQLTNDDYTTHLVVLGGIDWNTATRSVLSRLALPVRQVTDWNASKMPYFEVNLDENPVQYQPDLGPAHPDALPDRPVLREDVALFARARNPYDQMCTVTICNGMYGNGTYGAVRALTDSRFRGRNNLYIQENFGNKNKFCILTRVTIEDGVAVTPDWTIPETILFQWAG